MGSRSSTRKSEGSFEVVSILSAMGMSDKEKLEFMN